LHSHETEDVVQHLRPKGQRREPPHRATSVQVYNHKVQE
jgi:hypothetical protein